MSQLPLWDSAMMHPVPGLDRLAQQVTALDGELPLDLLVEYDGRRKASIQYRA